MAENIDVDVLPDTLEVYENRMTQAINDFCMSFDIQSLKSEPQNVYVACLLYVNRTVFKRLKPCKNNQSSIIDYDDIELLKGIADYYIYISAVYNKSVSVVDFCRLLGIDFQTMCNWRDDSIDNILSQKRFEIFKYINTMREQSLANILQTAKNPVGTLAILNRQFNWNLPGVSREEVKPKLSRNELLQGLDALPEKPIAIDSSDE